MGAAFAATLKKIGANLTAEDLTKLYPAQSKEDLRKETERLREEAKKQHGSTYLNQIMMSGTHHPLKKIQTTDYRLKASEKARLAANGFVVAERMQAESFADIYYRLYSDDMPVFVTADSILHAWHRSFDAFLVELEVEVLSQTLDKILESTLSKCCDAISCAPKDDSSQIRAMMDVELFLRVARSLLQGETLDGPSENSLKQEHLLEMIHSEETTTTEIFSAKRDVDFSQFKPRGHYTKSEELMRYFRAITWLGTVDFRVAGGDNGVEDIHQLHCAVLLVRFLLEAQTLEVVESVDSLISSLVADGGMGSDSLSPTQLARLLSTEDIMVDDDDQRLKILEGIQKQILQKGLGNQLINGHPRTENEPLNSTAPMTPPTSFALLGQRFVWSAFIFSRLVFDQVLHNDVKQKRRIPSAVDIAFTLFANNSATQVLANRMNTNPPNSASLNSQEFVPFRDGIQFSSNLVALRQVIDQEFDSEESKSGNAVDESTSISMLWQKALRELSRESPNAADTFHSQSWQHHKMNTQLASFSQLRHDTLLYSKQSYTMMCGCEYADGMVDPYPLFWKRMKELAMQMENMILRVVDPLAEFSHNQSKKCT